MSDDAERDATYGWARRQSLRKPYDFAIYYGHLWDEKAALVEAARRWERDLLHEVEADIEEKIAELRRELEIVKNDLERNETKEFGG